MGHHEFKSIGPLLRVIEPSILELSACTVSDQLLEEHFEAFGAFCDNNTKSVAILLTLAPQMALPASQRQRIAEFKKKMADHDRRYVAGVASVSPTALVRGLMTAVYWWQPPVYPHRFVPTRELGLAWIRRQLNSQQESQTAVG